MKTKILDVSGALLRETHGPSRVELKLTSCHSFGSVKTVSKKMINKRRIRLYFGLSYGVLGLDGFDEISLALPQHQRLLQLFLIGLT